MIKIDKKNCSSNLSSIKLNNEWNNFFQTLDAKCEEKYLGIKILHLIERDLQNYWLNLAETKLGWRRAFCLAELILPYQLNRRIKLYLRHISERYLQKKNQETKLEDLGWSEAAWVFVPTVENNLNVMLPLAKELKSNHEDVVFVVPAEAWRWPKYKALSEMFKVTSLTIYDVNQNKKINQVLLKFQSELMSALESEKSCPEVIKKKLKEEANSAARKMLYAVDSVNRYCQKFPPSALIAGRPKRIFPLAFLLAAKANSVNTIFMSHTAWFKKMDFLGKLYDLSLFDAAICLSNDCKKEIVKNSKCHNVLASGFPATNYKENGADEIKNLVGETNYVGYLAPSNLDRVSEILGVISRNANCFRLKTHPPGGDKKQIESMFIENGNIPRVFDHNEISLMEFFSNIDFALVAGSTAGFEAAMTGVPVISYSFDYDLAYLEHMSPTISPSDISVYFAESEEELDNVIKSVTLMNKKEIAKLGLEQKRLFSLRFPEYSASSILRWLYDIEYKKRSN